MTVWVADAHAHIHWLVLLFKMADRALGVYYRRAAFCFCVSCGQKTQYKRYLLRNVSCLWWEVFIA
jgi:hypothetical protein